MSSVEEFYEEMTPRYHLLFHNWDEAVRRHGDVLNFLIESGLGAGPKRILDAACGIGTQAIGLALHGHTVVGSDVSAPSLRRAHKEAARLSVEITTHVADMRTLTTSVSEQFDAVVVADNSFAHFLTQDELEIAVREVASATRSDGMMLASIRDYGKQIKERPQITSFRVIDGEYRRVVFQVWDWASTGDTYDLTQYLLLHNEGTIETTTFKSRLRAITRNSLTAALRLAGFKRIQWIESEASGFYQPIVIAWIS